MLISHNQSLSHDMRVLISNYSASLLMDDCCSSGTVKHFGNFKGAKALASPAPAYRMLATHTI